MKKYMREKNDGNESKRKEQRGAMGKRWMRI